MSTVRTARKRKITIKNDQYFVLPDVAIEIANFIKKQKFYSKIKNIIEPAAGDGGLLIHFWRDKERIVRGYDLYPQENPIAPYLKIEKQDFLLVSTYGYDRVATLIITGPPFGEKNDMAIKFFNKAAELADFIGMILPKSFMSKESIHRRLNEDFTLYAEMEMEEQSFYLPAEGPDQEPYPVPCVFQIWYRKPKGPGRPRKISSRVTRNTPKSTDDFEFTKNPQEADLAMIGIGWNAGKLVDTNTTMCKKSIHFIKVKQKQNIQKVISFFNEESWKEVKKHATGQRNISRKDIIRAYGSYQGL